MFAAYKSEISQERNETNTEFLQNSSFPSLETAVVPFSSNFETITSSSSSSSSEESEDETKASVVIYKKPPPVKISYYVDIEPRKEYLKLQSLPVRCLPRYRLSHRFKLCSPRSNYNSTKFKRYFSIKKKKKKRTDKAEKLDKDTIENDLKLYLSKNPNDIDKWIDYIQYRESVAVELSLEPSEIMAKNKLEAIEKARHFNPSDQKLLKLYLDTLPVVKPSEEVLSIIQDMIVRDQSNIFLWKHFLNNACNAMSCTAESGLKEYEKAIGMMKKINDSDIQMMQLFKMCGLFVRQAGLMEQFYALIHLMMSINVNVSSDFDRIFYSPSESQNPHLIEYEELVLQCKLPMPELWYRVETLRSICNFLPVQVSNEIKIEDPQRYVFNEDISNLVNPLKNQRAYSFDLFLLTLKLFKFPLPYYKNFLNNEIFANDDREIECGMSFLTVLLSNFSSTSNQFEKVFFNVIKDLNVSPNFLSFNILHEPLLECMLKFLESCLTSFNERQNKIVLILWLRLQRLIVRIDQQKNFEPAELTQYKKQIKSRVKNILKASKYQNDLSIYREFALMELSLNEEKSCFNILNMAIDACGDDEVNFYKLLIEFCELKLLRNDKEAVLAKLTKVCGSQFYKEKLTNATDDPCDEIEDFFLSNGNKLELIKAFVIHQLLTKSKKAALQELSKQISSSNEGSHLREQLYEFYTFIFHLKIISDETLINHRDYMKTISQALIEFPKNILIMHTIACQSSLRWFDIRKLLLKTPTSESIFYLLIASKFFEENFADDESKIYQHRIFNTIDGLMSRKTPGISSVLTWRLYLRAAFNYDFGKCRRIIYEAFSNYPMVKLFYLDGSRYLSEDLSQFHDLIIEKGIRIHSLIEELEILRSANK